MCDFLTSQGWISEFWGTPRKKRSCSALHYTSHAVLLQLWSMKFCMYKKRLVTKQKNLLMSVGTQQIISSLSEILSVCLIWTSYLLRHKYLHLPHPMARVGGKWGRVWELKTVVCIAQNGKMAYALKRGHKISTLRVWLSKMQCNSQSMSLEQQNLRTKIQLISEVSGFWI